MARPSALDTVRSWFAPRPPVAPVPVAGLDDLTGLPGVGRLREDLTAFFALHRGPDDQREMLMFDLVGFKKYNDAFGFACGDALLRRLSRKLVDAVGDRGVVYRLRGPQFAILTPPAETAAVRLAAGDALFEMGEGFVMRSAQGSVLLPGEAADASEALKLADQEVQAERVTLRSQGVDDLSITSPAGGTPRPGTTGYDVGDISATVGYTLGLAGPELEGLERAAALRDVGMLSVPDAIVETPGPLTDEDRHFVQLHPLVGERLLRSNFGMDSVATLVRSSHERWDGGGYPDGRAGEEIPLAARILFVCGAFEDMTAPRSHRPARSAEQALRELEENAGSQFDPAVVAAFVGAFSELADTPARVARG
jgi:diguanylate cyclase (GGDEF)-like protein